METNLKTLSIGELLNLSRAALRELRDRGVVRTGNAPVGDYAELLVQHATDGELGSNSQSSWDVLTPTGERLQVKARVVTDPRNQGERQLSVFRSWDFDAAVVVLFDDDLQVWKAARIAVDRLQAAARLVEHVRGYRVIATDQFMALGENWTPRLRSIVV